MYNHIDDSTLDFYESIYVQRGWSALHVASEKGHLEVVKCLLEKGANINDKDEVRYISSIHYCPFDNSLCFLCIV